MSGDTRPADSPRRLGLLLACLVPALVSAALHWRTVDGYLLSDDLGLAAAIFGADAPAHVDWASVRRSFHEPWMFGAKGLYRPLATWFHAGSWHFTGDVSGVRAVNLALQSAVVAAFAWLVSSLSRSALAAGVAATLLAVHPAAHETTGWICAQSELLCLLSSFAATGAFVRGLRTGRQGAYVLAFVAAAVALSSRENAMLLPLVLVGADLAVRGRAGAPIRHRLALHAAFAPLWLAYLVARRLVLGKWIGGYGMPLQSDSFLAQVGHGVLGKAAATMLPVDPSFPLWATLALGGGFALAAALTIRGRAWLAVLGLLGASWGIQLRTPIESNLYGSRLVVVGVVALAGGIGVGLARGSRRRQLVVCAAVAGASVAGAVLTHCCFDRYERCWHWMRRLQRDVEDAASSADERHPAVLGFAEAEVPAPFLDPFLVFPLARPPLARATWPFVCLTGAIQHTEFVGDLTDDMDPFRATWRHGSPLLYWSTGQTGGTMRAVPPPAATPTWRRDGDAFVPVDGVASPWDVEGFVLRAPTLPARGRLRCTAIDGAVVVLPFANGSPSQSEHRIDCSRDRDFLVRMTLGGGLARVAVEGEGEGSLRNDVELSSYAQSPPLAGGTVFAGATVALSALTTTLRPPAEATEGPGRIRLVLLNGSSQIAIDCDREGLRPTRAQLEYLSIYDRFARTDRHWFYWLLRTDAGARRSPIDWIRLDGSR